MASGDVESLLRSGIQAAQAGNKQAAKNLFVQALKLDPRNITGWMWMVQVAETDKERQFCLEKILEINPDNQQARAALQKLQGTPAPPPQPAPPPPEPSFDEGLDFDFDDAWPDMDEAAGEAAPAEDDLFGAWPDDDEAAPAEPAWPDMEEAAPAWPEADDSGDALGLEWPEDTPSSVSEGDEALAWPDDTAEAGDWDLLEPDFELEGDEEAGEEKKKRGRRGKKKEKKEKAEKKAKPKKERRRRGRLARFLILFISALVVALIAIVVWKVFVEKDGGGGDGGGPALTTYQGDGFSIGYPSDWLITEEIEGQVTFANGEADPETGAIPDGFATASLLSAPDIGLTPGELLAMYSEDEIPGRTVEELDQGTVTIAGSEAAFIFFKAMEEDTPDIYSYIGAAAAEDRSFVFVGASISEGTRDTFADMFASLSVEAAGAEATPTAEPEPTEEAGPVVFEGDIYTIELPAGWSQMGGAPGTDVFTRDLTGGDPPLSITVTVSATEDMALEDLVNFYVTTAAEAPDATTEILDEGSVTIDGQEGSFVYQSIAVEEGATTYNYLAVTTLEDDAFIFLASIIDEDDLETVETLLDSVTFIAGGDVEEPTPEPTPTEEEAAASTEEPVETPTLEPEETPTEEAPSTDTQYAGEWFTITYPQDWVIAEETQGGADTQQTVTLSRQDIDLEGDLPEAFTFTQITAGPAGGNSAEGLVDILKGTAASLMQVPNADDPAAVDAAIETISFDAVPLDGEEGAATYYSITAGSEQPAYVYSAAVVLDDDRAFTYTAFFTDEADRETAETILNSVTFSEVEPAVVEETPTPEPEINFDEYGPPPPPPPSN